LGFRAGKGLHGLVIGDLEWVKSHTDLLIWDLEWVKGHTDLLLGDLEWVRSHTDLLLWGFRVGKWAHGHVKFGT